MSQFVLQPLGPYSLMASAAFLEGFAPAAYDGGEMAGHLHFAFVADGKLGPGGALPTNTGGGELSAYYMWGFTPLSEAVVQARGQAGERQVEKHDVILVSGNGGVLNYHSTTILSKHPA